MASDGRWYPPELHPSVWSPSHENWRTLAAPRSSSARPGAPWWLGLMIVAGGGLVFLVGAFFSFYVGICDIGSIGSVGSCSRTENTEALLGAVVALLAFLGAPALASICTRLWWWSALPVLISVAFWGFEYHNNPGASSWLREVGALVLMSIAEMGVVGVVFRVRRVSGRGSSSPPGLSPTPPI